MLSLSERKANEVWETSDKAMLFHKNSSFWGVKVSKSEVKVTQCPNDSHVTGDCEMKTLIDIVDGFRLYGLLDESGRNVRVCML